MIPSLSFQIIDPGSAGLPATNAQIPVYIGISSAGTEYEVHEYARRADMIAELGIGHVVDVASADLDAGAASVKVLKVPAVAAGTIDQGTDTLTVTSITGDPLHFIEGRIEILSGTSGPVSGGAVLARYSLDAWEIPNVDPTFSAPFLVPASGLVLLPDIGLTVHLTTAQTPVAGAFATFSVTPGHYGATEIAACQDALRSPLAGQYTFLVFTGDAATASAANTCAGAIEALLTALFTEAYFCGAMFGCGLEPDDDVLTSFASASFTTPPFGSGGYGAAFVTNGTAQVGRGRVGLREHEVAAIRARQSLISTDLGRTASGPLTNVVGTDYDAALEGASLHDARVSVLRNWYPSGQGYYITRQRLLTLESSDFRSWQHAAVMISALRAAHRIMYLMILEGFRAAANGTIDGRDASDVKEAVDKELARTLMTEQNARGTIGHASAVASTVDRTVLLPSVTTEIKIRPLGYAETLTVKLQYAGAV